MPAEIRIYFEGAQALRPGFSEFFRKLTGKPIKTISVGSRYTACRDFHLAVDRFPRAFNILLLDSEEPLTPELAKAFCPVHADSIYWMVQTMEAWFHADKEALKHYYGPKFNPAKLKQNLLVEQILKKDLEDGLKAATKDTSKGDYYGHKTSHASKVLALIDPLNVRRSAPNCDQLFKAIEAHLATP